MKSSPRTSSGVPSGVSAATSSMSDVADLPHSFLAFDLPETIRTSSALAQLPLKSSSSTAGRRHGGEQPGWAAPNCFPNQDALAFVDLGEIAEDPSMALDILCQELGGSSPLLQAHLHGSFEPSHADAVTAATEFLRRRPGRPRVNDDRPPVPQHADPTAVPQESRDVSEQEGYAVRSGGSEGATKKRSRGPKPKYVFSTAEEAEMARRERNRKAALASYYRKRQRWTGMEQQAKDLEEENAALEKLLAQVEAGETAALTEASDAGINAWLAAYNKEGGSE